MGILDFLKRKAPAAPLKKSTGPRGPRRRLLSNGSTPGQVDAAQADSGFLRFLESELSHKSPQTPQKTRRQVQMELGRQGMFADAGWSAAGGPVTRDWQRDLSPELWSRHFRMCHEKFVGNTYAQAGICNVSNYVVSSGMVPRATNPDPVVAAAVQVYLDKWWQINECEDLLDERCTSLAVESELIYRIPRPGRDGISRMCAILPEWVHYVERDPGCPEVLKGVKLHASMVCRDWGSCDGGETYGMQESSKDYFELIRRTGQGLEGEVVMVRVNALRGQTRGISDILNPYEDLEDVEQLSELLIEGVTVQRSIAWFLKLKGLAGAGNDTRMQARAAELQAKGPPASGSVNLIDPESEEWECNAPQVNITEPVQFIQQKQTQAVAGLFNPLHWMGSGTETNKATASEMTGPVFQNISKRKRIVTKFHRIALEFALQEALKIKAPLLMHPVTRQPLTMIECAFVVVSRDSSDRSMQALGAGLQSLAQALAIYEGNRWMSPTDCATIAQSAMVELGYMQKVNVPKNVDEGLKAVTATEEKTPTPVVRSGIPKN
jgi:hypothetical protein